MSNRYRLVALVGLVLLGAAIAGIFAFMGDDEGAAAADDARAYLAAWREGDYAAMRELAVEPPTQFDTLPQQIVDNLRIGSANYQLGEGEGPGRIVGLEPRAIQDLDQVKAALQQELGVDPAAVDEALGAPGVQPDHFVPIITVSQATYTQAEPVIYPLPGTRFRDTTVRTTPSPGFAQHVLGRTGEVTAERLEELGPPYQAGDVVGFGGIEATYETQLAGTPSGDIQLTDAEGEVVEVLDRIEGRAPQPVATTLDRTAQSAVESAMGTSDQPVAAVVVDRDGNVRAAASRPLADFNRALAGRYAPGSTFKVVTTGALLANGVTPDTPVECAQTTNAGGREFKNFESSSLGTVPFGLAFAESCNTAFITASADVPDADLVAAAESFGFNTDYSTGLNTFGGSFPTPSDATEHAAASIGQGRVEASPLHMASVAAAVIDGTWDAPVLLPDPPTGDDAARAGGETTSTEAGTDTTATTAAGGTETTAAGGGPDGEAGAGFGPGAPPARPEPRTLPQGTAETLFGLMRRVVTEGSGQEAAITGVEIAGKTGTAEFGTGDPLPTHAWFIGIRGDHAVAVLVEDEVPDPVPAEGQVRIAVEAAGVHLLDTVIRKGESGGPYPLPDLPMTPGREVAGRVDLVGPGVDEAWHGRRAVAHLGMASGGYPRPAR